jgi:hypothetical protein
MYTGALMSTHLVRKQIYIYKRQQVLLKQLAKDRGLSESEIIRQSLDRDVDKAVTRSLQGSRDSWDETVAFMRSLADRWAQRIELEDKSQSSRRHS